MVQKQGAFFQFLVFIVISVCLLSFMSCNMKKSVILDENAAPQKDIPLETVYRKIIIHNFEADKKLTQSRPNAVVLCENAALSELLKIGSVPMIVKTAPKSLRETNTIIVKVRLTYLQVRGKSQNGSMKMTAQVRLIDASIGKTVSEKNISLADNPSAASTGDTSELGKLIARYISQVVQSH